jgi:hypothetical protein
MSKDEMPGLRPWLEVVARELDLPEGVVKPKKYIDAEEFVPDRQASAGRGVYFRPACVDLGRP